MSEVNSKTPNENSKEGIIPPSSTTEYVGESIRDQPQAVPVKPDTDSINKEPIQVVVNIPKEETQPAITANRIAIFGVFVNIALGVLTYLLFLKTGEANRTAQGALEQARIANEIAERNFIAAQEATKFSDSVSRANINVAKQSLGAQIKAITESQDKFSVENEPYLQMTIEIMPTINIRSAFFYRVKIENLGKYPVLVLKMNNLSAMRKVKPKFEEVYDPENAVDVESKYITSSKPFEDINYETRTYDSRSIEAMISGTMFFYSWGYVDYKNLATKKIKRYKYMIKYSSNGLKNVLANYNFIINENVEIK